MTGYKWGDSPPDIAQHSVTKHEILENYLFKYIDIRVSHPRMTTLSIDFVDGFSGGGLYCTRDMKTHKGSPLIALAAAKAAEAHISTTRNPEFKLDIRFHFIDNDAKAVECLKYALKQEGYDTDNSDNIFVHQGDFIQLAPKLVESIKARNSYGIFLLDQYGYTNVPVSVLKNIFSVLRKPEIFLTFNVDSLLDYISDTPKFKKSLETVGLVDAVPWGEIELLKQQNHNWRLIIQASLYKAIIEKSGAIYYTPFFIYSEEANRDYWFLHLSAHERARDAMSQIHWLKHTTFRHYGKAGFNMFMLGYKPSEDSNHTGQDMLFSFDEEAEQMSVSSLQNDIPRFIFSRPDGISFGEMFRDTCNGTPASSDIYKKTLGVLLAENELSVTGPNGEKRRVGNRITSKDIIIPTRQLRFTFA